MDLHRAFVRHVAFPLQETLKGHDTLRVLKGLRETQWVAPETLAAQRERDLRVLLTHIGRTVPYYRALFADHGFDPDSATELSLQRLPLLDKDTIRSRPDDFRADDAPPMRRSNTGGSTGSPLVFWLTRERVSHDVAAKLRSFEWWDVTFGDREAVIWGAPHEVQAQDRLRTLRDRLFRSTLIPAFSMGDPDIERYIGTLQHLRPRIIFGYPSAIALIARRAREDGIDLKGLGVNVIFTTAEQLYPHQRTLIEAVFGARVANGYGARDAGFIAHECPAGGMHLTAEDIIVECVDGDGLPVPTGEAGEIVVTHLRNTGYPLVRYRTGDLGRLSTSSCPCGRTLPLLEEISGRTTDFLQKADGTRVHALALIYILRDLPAVREFKIIQKTRDRTEVLLDADSPAADLESRIVGAFQKVLGPQVSIDIEFVSPIPRERTGKFRYVQSEIAA